MPFPTLITEVQEGMQPRLFKYTNVVEHILSWTLHLASFSQQFQEIFDFMIISIIKLKLSI